MRPLTAAFFLCALAAPVFADESIELNFDSPSKAPATLGELALRVNSQIPRYERPDPGIFGAPAAAAFQRLYDANPVLRRGIGLRLIPDPPDATDEGVGWNPRAGSIDVTWRFLDKTRGDPDVLTSVFAHEFGHTLQPLGRMDELGRRRFEAHADLLGLGLAANAGAGPERYARGMMGFLNPGSAQYPPWDSYNPRHPSLRRRFLNIVAYGPLIAAGEIGMPKLEDLGEDGAVIPSKLLPDRDAAARAAIDRYVEPPELLLRQESDPGAPYPPKALSESDAWAEAAKVTLRMREVLQGTAPIRR